MYERKGEKDYEKSEKAAGILLALTLAASLVTGCGGSSSKAQEEKDTLTVAITGDPPTLDPACVIHLKQCKQLKSCLRDPGEI